MRKQLRDALKRMQRIATLIESIENRAMAADGPVTNTREEMTDAELREIYFLAKRAIHPLRSKAAAKNFKTSKAMHQRPRQKQHARANRTRKNNSRRQQRRIAWPVAHGSDVI